MRFLYLGRGGGLEGGERGRNLSAGVLRRRVDVAGFILDRRGFLSARVCLEAS